LCNGNVVFGIVVNILTDRDVISVYQLRIWGTNLEIVLEYVYIW
jgi:hypothetical protein